MSIRRVIESPLRQGADEQIQYKLTTTPWGSDPTSVSVVVFESGEDVTSTVMPTGTPQVEGDVITLPVLKSLEAGKDYRVEVKFTAGGSVWEAYFNVFAEK